jgi:rare lipoprotein A
MNFKTKLPSSGLRWVFLALSTASILSGSVSALAQSSTPSKPETAPFTVQWGKASYYGGHWIGKLTASGERYHPGDYTAAHKKLPFNTMVRVTNRKNGQSVIVRINDRGPYGKGRILDLSMAAAWKIHMIGAGTVPVKLEVLNPSEILGNSNHSSPGS